MKLLKLLQGRNRCLTNLSTRSKEFLSSTEKGDFSSLQTFQVNREKTLKTLILYDHQISGVIERLSILEKSQELILSVQPLQKTQEKLIHDILEIDKKIMLQIQDESHRLLKDLSMSAKNHQIVNKFKSTWLPEAGEQLDGVL